MVPGRLGLMSRDDRHPFAYGDDDLLPGGLGGGMGGGMALGPSHAMFTDRFAMGDPRRHRPPVPGLPPRARFDAFGAGGREPDPDHLPPPGYGDMFM